MSWKQCNDGFEPSPLTCQFEVCLLINQKVHTPLFPARLTGTTMMFYAAVKKTDVVHVGCLEKTWVLVPHQTISHCIPVHLSPQGDDWLAYLVYRWVTHQCHPPASNVGNAPEKADSDGLLYDECNSPTCDALQLNHSLVKPGWKPDCDT